MQAPTPQAGPPTVGRYEILFRIASGGMAEVFAARVRGEAGFEKLVALKRMLPHLTDDDRFITMFLDEGRLAAHISSPYVVGTLDQGRADDGSLFLVMELVVGVTLSALLRNVVKKKRPMPPGVACALLTQAAMGLHDAHEATTPTGESLELIHRDISPQNILCGITGRARITDFGVARALQRHTKTQTGEFKGKLSYFAPEQVASKDLDRRIDIFALGIVAWETLTGRRLFWDENPLAILEKVTKTDIPKAKDVAKWVPQEVSDVVAKALERDRELRYSTAGEFALELRAAAQASCGMATGKVVGQFVREHGGDQLQKMEVNIRAAHEQPQWAPPPPSAPDPSDSVSGVMLRSKTGELPAGSLPIESSTDPIVALEDDPYLQSQGGGWGKTAAIGIGIGLLFGVLAAVGVAMWKSSNKADVANPNGITAPPTAATAAADPTEGATTTGTDMATGAATPTAPGDLPSDAQLTGTTPTEGDTPEQVAAVPAATPMGTGRVRPTKRRGGRATRPTTMLGGSSMSSMSSNTPSSMAEGDAENAQLRRDLAQARREREEADRRAEEERRRRQAATGMVTVIAGMQEATPMRPTKMVGIVRCFNPPCD